MQKRSILKYLGLLSLTVSLLSCEQEFTEMGSEVIDSDQFNFDKYVVQNITTENKITSWSNTRNLPINNFGIYTESAFGKTIGHLVTQIEMKSNTALSAIGENPVLDSVYVYMPFTSSVTSTDSDGNKSYDVSNVYGNGSFTLNVYENGYFLRNSDPNNNFENQFYYTNDKPAFDANKKGIDGVGRLNNSEFTSQNVSFSFNKNEIKLMAYNADGTAQLDANNKQKVKERLAPGVWLDLDKNYFQNKFFNGNKYKSISNNGDLKNYFRGLYFEVLENSNQNALAQLDLSKAKMVFVYKVDGDLNTETNKPKRERKTLEFNIGYAAGSDSSVTATTVNLLESNFVFNNNSFGNIWLKGGAKSSYASINLFGNDADGNGKADELEELIKKDLLINQAVLTVYVDHASTGLDTLVLPKQLFLYDLKNEAVIVDYTKDPTINGKNVYGGVLNTLDKSVYKYQFRVTDHINNLISKDSTNVPLGLVVANGITNSNMNIVKDSSKKIPLLSTMNPFGVVVYGPEASNGNLRMKLDIYYTKENK